MNKKEFLDTLREQLQGRMSQGEIEENIRYYDGYISQQAAAGKGIEQIMEELGSPVFIAKTLADTAKTSADDGGGYRSGQDYTEEDAKEDLFGGRVHTFHMNEKVAAVVIPLVLILVAVLFFTLLGTVAVLVARYLIPILIVVLIAAIFKSRKG